MKLTVCKWYNNADSPVMLMVDDLANVWVDAKLDGKLHLEDDWGYWKDEERSSFRFLNEVLLADYPDMKVTFFVPVGFRTGMVTNGKFPFISGPINSDEETKRFFRQVHENPRFELAYHGTTHGVAGPSNRDFIQEWETFQSVDEAVRTIQDGISIFKDAVGVAPLGGKYCGYMSNAHSDESINQSGFSWWCRYWNRGVPEQSANSGRDTNPLTNFDVKTFGSNRVIDIPSTVGGDLLNPVLNNSRKSRKDFVRYAFRNMIIRRKLKQIEFLLEHRLVISIQEHISPARNDGRRQSPNIFDDKNSLLCIFEYLRNKNVWYCTGTELANYVRAREKLSIRMTDEHAFTLGGDVQDAGQRITLKCDYKAPFQMILPNGEPVDAVSGIINIPVMSGTYWIDLSRSGSNEYIIRGG